MAPPGPCEGSPVFFTNFPGYIFNASATCLENFKELSAQRGWSVGSFNWNLNWRKCFGRGYTYDQDPLDTPSEDSACFEFFDAFPDYQVDCNTTVFENFKRLALRRRWAVDSPTWRRQWRTCFGCAFKMDNPSAISLQSTFFSTFQDYRMDSSIAIIENFKRLALHRGWTVNSTTWRRHWHTCFGRAYTEDENPFKNHAQSTYFADFPNYCVDRSVSILENFKRLSIKSGWAVASPMWLHQWRTCFGREYTEPENPFSESDEEEDSDTDFGGSSDISIASTGDPEDFRPVPPTTLDAQFARMALDDGIEADTDEYDELRAAFYQDEFGRLFGRSEDVLANWQNLCRIAGVEVGTSITQCKKVCSPFHIPRSYR